MGRRGKSARKAAYAARAAARRAAEEELRAAVEREGDARRQAAYSVAKAFVKQFMPRAERMGAFCGLLKLREMKRKAKKNKTTVMYESLEYMQMSCRHCLVGAEWGYWHCECEEDRWDHGEKDDEEEQEQSGQLTEEEDEEVTSDDGSEWEDGFETDTGDDEEQQQNEEQRTPEKAPATSVMKISPENAATRTWGGKVLFRK